MKKTALFLGAGFSLEFGMPLVWELTAELKNWLTPEKFIGFNRNWRSEGNGYSDIVEERFLTLLTSPIHYEAILGGLEVEADRPENSRLRDEFHGVRGWLLDAIYLLLHQRIVLNPGYIKMALSLHRGIKHLMTCQKPLWIFSLNHDLVVEMLCAKYSAELKGGFGNTEENLAFDKGAKVSARFRVWDMNDPAQAAGTYFTTGQAGVNLLKIHGALDIFGFKDLNQYLWIQPDTYSVEGFIETLNKLDKIYGLPKVNEELIVFDSAGVEQFLRKSVLSGVFKFRKGSPGKVPKMTLSLFQSYLNHAEELIVMGYGFGDEHVNRILRDWLEFTFQRTMKIVDPFRTSIPMGFEHMVQQVEIVQTTSLEFLTSLPGGELTRAEKFWVNLKKFARTPTGKKIGRLTRPLFLKLLQHRGKLGK